MAIKEHVKNVDTWVRGLFILVFAVLFHFLSWLIFLLAGLQFLTKVLTGNLNANLSNFSVSLTAYAFQILLYITYQSEDRPFPISPWPSQDSEATETSATEEATEGDEPKDDS